MLSIIMYIAHVLSGSKTFGVHEPGLSYHAPTVLHTLVDYVIVVIEYIVNVPVN